MKTMKKMMTLLAIAALVLAQAPAAQASPAPPFGHAGGYRYAFKTTTAHRPTNSTIGFYNGIVDAEGDTELASDWRVIGSTAADNARDNTGTTLEDSGATDVPIYNALGEKIWDGNTEMWDGTTTPLMAMIRHIDGANPTTGGDGQRIWSGTNPDGTTDTGNELGASTVTRGIHANTSAGHMDGQQWIDIGQDADTGEKNIYGLSGVLTAVAPTVPTILISGSSTLIYPGDTTPSTADATDFGSVGIGGGVIARTYTVSNFGTAGAALGLSAPSISGSAAFAVTTGLGSTNLAAGEFTTFTVTYTAHSGARSVDDAKVSVVNNATDNDPYEFAITATTTNAGVVTVPGDGYTDPYRIAFVTLGKRGAKSTDIADYNDFVTTEAGLIPELDALGVEWKCIGSTLAVSAKTNTSTHTTGDANDVPIYTTTGQRIADDNADLWDSNIQNPIFYGDGTANSGQIWTGTKTTGESADGTPWGWHLGVGVGFNIVGGGDGRTDSAWIYGFDSHDGEADGGSTYTKHFMALSGLLGLPPAGTVFVVR
jgi:hypothetical protein